MKSLGFRMKPTLKLLKRNRSLSFTLIKYTIIIYNKLKIASVITGNFIRHTYLNICKQDGGLMSFLYIKKLKKYWVVDCGGMLPYEK